MEGKSITEVSFIVGYNSPAQFSREYKRQFGILPSIANFTYTAEPKTAEETSPLHSLCIKVGFVINSRI